jgi:two-component system chemotaxis response regulator CheY
MTVPHAAPTTVLIIDDEASALENIAGILSGAGHACQCAQDAAEAHHCLEQSTPDLIISDVNLAGRSGLSLCEKLKHEFSLDDVPLMFLSAAQSPDIIRRAHAAGGSYYLRKPFDPRVLLELIGKARSAGHLTAAP